MSKHVDLRCSRRLTLQEARALVELVEATKPTRGQFRGVGNAVKKLRAALLLAEHECKFSREGFCKVCKRPRGFVAFNPWEHLLRGTSQRAKMNQEIRAADLKTEERKAQRNRVFNFPTGGGAA